MQDFLYTKFEMSDISHAFLPLTTAKLLALNNSPVFPHPL